jgi:hypothetical protein
MKINATKIKLATAAFLFGCQAISSAGPALGQACRLDSPAVLLAQAGMDGAYEAENDPAGGAGMAEESRPRVGKSGRRKHAAGAKHHKGAKGRRHRLGSKLRSSPEASLGAESNTCCASAGGM